MSGAARLARSAGILPDETALLALVATTFVALESGRGMGDVGAYALIAPAILPYLYIPLGAILIVAALGFGVGLSRIARGRLFTTILVGFAILLVIERVAMALGAPAAVQIAWLTVAAAGATAMTIGWAVAASTFDARQAKRLFPLCTAAAIAGYALGSLAAGPLAKGIGTESLIVAEGVMFLVASATISRLAGRRPTPAWGAPTGPRRTMVADVRVGFDEVRASALLSRVAAAYILLAILLVAITVPFWTAARLAIPDDAERAGTVGIIAAVVTGISFVLSLTVAKRFYARFGVATAALLLPAAYLVGFILWAATFSFATAVLVLGSVQVVQRGLSNAAWSAFATTIPAHRRAQVMIFLDGVPGQIGTILSGILLLTAARILDPVQGFVAGALIAALAVVVVFEIRRRYAASLLATLRRGLGEQVLEGGPGLGDLIDTPDVRVALVRALGDRDPRVRELAASMLAKAPGDDTLDALAAALDDPVAAVRAAAATAMIRHDAVHPAHIARGEATIEALLDGGADERAAGLGALAILGRRPSEERLAAALRDPRPEVRAAAVETLTTDPARVDDLIACLRDPTYLVRRIASDALAGLPAVPAPVTALIDEPDPAVQLAAMASMAGHGHEVREVLVPWADGQVARAMSMATSAGALQTDEPSPIRAFLVDVLRQRRERAQDLALAALGVVEVPEARTTVRRCLRSTDTDVRAQAIEMLDSVGDRRLGRSIARLVEVENAAPPAHPAPVVLADLRDDVDPWIRGLAERVETTEGGGVMPDQEASLGGLERMLELRRVPLFERLAPEDLQRVAAVAVERAFPAGAPIVHEGEVGDELYVLLEGTVRVERLDPDGSTRVLRTYGPGDHFGELAVLLERPRVATVVAQDDVRTMVIAGEGLTAILRERPDAAMALLATLAERISAQ